MENPIKMDDLGVPLFLETPTCNLINAFLKGSLNPSQKFLPHNISKERIEMLTISCGTATSVWFNEMMMMCVFAMKAPLEHHCLTGGLASF